MIKKHDYIYITNDYIYIIFYFIYLQTMLILYYLIKNIEIKQNLLKLFNVKIRVHVARQTMECLSRLYIK